MNIEISRLQFILPEKIEEDIIILSENHEVENRYLSDILLVKIYGPETDFV
jgi:hypothetical protein